MATRLQYLISGFLSRTILYSTAGIVKLQKGTLLPDIHSVKSTDRRKRSQYNRYPYIKGTGATIFIIVEFKPDAGTRCV